jgi:hypothetical protein
MNQSADRNAMTISLESDPGITGVAIYVNWNDIEPQPGVYDWTTLDQFLAPAVAAGRPVSLALEAGNYAPPWLSAAPYSVPGATFVQQSQVQCITGYQFTPWAVPFESQFLHAESALAAHVAASGAQVYSVKLTGINWQSGELRMPFQESGPFPDIPCNVTDATTQWLTLGYKQSLIGGAAQAIYGGIEAIWGVPPVLEMISHNALPWINGAGQASTEKSTEAFFALMVGRAVASGASMGWLGLASNTTIPTNWENEGQAGLLQLGVVFYGQANVTACGLGVSCSDADFGAILQAGIASGAREIEVWPGDFIYEDQIAAANAQLQALAAERKP